MMLELYSRLLELPSLEIAKRINDQGAALMEHYADQIVTMATVSLFDQDHLAKAESLFGKGEG